MKRRRLQAVERTLLLFLWGVVIGVAAAGIAVLVADIVAGDWKYGTVAQLAGVAASVLSSAFMLWTTHRALHATWERDEMNMYTAAQVVELDRIAAGEIDRLEARLEREQRSRGNGVDPAPGQPAPHG